MLGKWFWCGAMAVLGAIAGMAFADNGVIVPSDKQAPDAAVLAIDSLQIRVVVDGGHARVRLQEVFANKTNKVLEGAYSLVLPGDAAISDFAVWDDLTRIPGVILERKRAGELYAQIRNEAIDPGLLQSGEVAESNDEGQARRSSEFSAKIVPIPAYGFKRVEAEYRETIPVEQWKSAFVLPLKGTGVVQTAGTLSISVEIRSSQPISDFQVAAQALPLTVSKRDSHLILATYEAKNAPLNQDLHVEYKLQPDHKPGVAAYRDGAGEPGYFEASHILADPGARKEKPSSPARTVLILFDTSLSMQWEKLERSFQALETTLRSLRNSDNFNVLVFNSDVQMTAPQPVPVSPEAIAKALDIVRASRLKGGTNLEQALRQAFAQTTRNSYIVLLSDGEMTEGQLGNARFEKWFDTAFASLPADRQPRFFALALGDDANLRLMRNLASHGGVFEQIRSTEPVDFKLNSFVNKIGLSSFDSVSLSVSPEVQPDFIYRLGDSNFPGSRASWVGEYRKPASATFTVNQTEQGRPAIRETTRASLPEKDTAHEYLPLTWARARVDTLLEKIDREGEDKATIDEIIRLSRKYKFVTPYTSFLAAPRALLRPRLIRPGDPVLRVRTDTSILSVIALFPFGLTKPLRYLPSEDIWQTRFLAPDDLPDGVHTVRLILRDRQGHVYREKKTFLISSQPPVVRVRLSQQRVRAGDRVQLRVQASETTRTITARLYGAAPVSVHWSEDDKTNTGTLVVPASLPAGHYHIHVTAEDIAHNVSRQEVPVEVLP